MVRERSPPARGRGLKLRVWLSVVMVSLSPPARGRGLKLRVWLGGVMVSLSPPPRGRGLKPESRLLARWSSVAPRAGAWIETNAIAYQPIRSDVAPRAGA